MRGGLLAAWLAGQAGFAAASAPTLYSQPANESPVRADHDDLLLLGGDGLSSTDRAVYALIRNTTYHTDHPVLRAVPVKPTASLGFADVVNASDAPHSLAIRLPMEISDGQSYAVWIVNAQGEWSNGVTINDARPMWISPDFAYTTGSVANLPRALKVIGRNLQPAPNTKTRVRLAGPRTYTLIAEDDGTSLSRYVAQVALPPSMEAGSYSIQVSRDGVSWVDMLGEHGARARTLSVVADPPALPVVSVHDYSCDRGDDTSCVVNAIAAAGDKKKFPNGATVVFDTRTYRLSEPGTWSPATNASSKNVDFQGIWVPKRVNLLGKGIAATIVERGTGWVTTKQAPSGGSAPIGSLFNLQGDNTVQGFTFSDANIYTPSSNTNSAALSLGIEAQYAKDISLADPRLSHVVISRNEFKVPVKGILGRGLPLDHLFITYNTLGAYENGLYINRWGNSVATSPFDLTDSVIAYNTFHPSSFQNVVASQLGGGTRLDFSNNTADGTSTLYLYRPDDRKGFRAGFFWNLSYNSELKLISRNRVLCSGDKPGDGEGIVFDGDDETVYGGFERTAAVSEASPQGTSGSKVTVAAEPMSGPLGFVGQWLQVVQGPGSGQLRKITSYTSDGGAATFTVSPPFDVLPRAGSAVTVGLENWQSYVVENLIDHSSPTCVNGYKSPASAGALAFYAQTADSVIEGNQLLATNGISLTHQYMLFPGKPAFLMLQAANEVRGNLIDHGPLLGGMKGLSGIRINYVATAGPPSLGGPPVLGFGTVIAGNRLIEAEDAYGAIEFETAGSVGLLNSRGGCAASWRIGAAPLIFHNELRGSRGIDINGRLVGPRPRTCASDVRDSIVWHATLYGNSCTGVARSLTDSGTETQAVCRAGAANSCECATGQQAQ